jgi:branched-chain amino acid transport system substrate-binding protein
MKIQYKYIVLAIIVIVGVLVYFNNNSNNDSNVIKIGVVGPFSGPAASFGDYMQNGLNLALEGVPQSERSNYKIIKEDDKCNGSSGISAVQKLITVDKVNYIIGPMCNEASISTETLFEDNGVMSISIGLPSNRIANMGPNHFTFSPEIEYLMKDITSNMQSKNFKRVGIIHMQGAFEDENYKHFVKYFKDNGGTIVADEAVVKGLGDFKTSVLKIKESNPDSLMIVAHGGDFNNILKEMNVQGVNNLPKFGIHAIQGPITDYKLAEGIIYAYPKDKLANDAGQDYALKYKNKYGVDADLTSANVYDAFNILKDSIAVCGYENKDCVRNKLASLNNYQGANGSLSVDSRGVGMYKELMLKAIKDGKFVEVK